MHPQSLEIFKLTVEKPFEEQEAFLRECLTEEKVPNYEMAKLLFEEAKELIKVHQLGVIAGIKKIQAGLDNLHSPKS